MAILNRVVLFVFLGVDIPMLVVGDLCITVHGTSRLSGVLVKLAVLCRSLWGLLGMGGVSTSVIGCCPLDSCTELLKSVT